MENYRDRSKIGVYQWGTNILESKKCRFKYFLAQLLLDDLAQLAKDSLRIFDLALGRPVRFTAQAVLYLGIPRKNAARKSFLGQYQTKFFDSE